MHITVAFVITSWIVLKGESQESLDTFKLSEIGKSRILLKIKEEILKFCMVSFFIVYINCLVWECGITNERIICPYFLRIVTGWLLQSQAIATEKLPKNIWRSVSYSRVTTLQLILIAIITWRPFEFDTKARLLVTIYAEIQFLISLFIPIGF